MFNKELKIDIIDKDNNPKYKDIIDLTKADIIQLERAYMRLNIKVNKAIKEQDKDNLRKYIF